MKFVSWVIVFVVIGAAAAARGGPTWDLLAGRLTLTPDGTRVREITNAGVLSVA